MRKLSNIQSKNIIITGASSGIGHMMAIQVAKQGGNPILVARTEARLKKLQEQLVDTYDVDCRFYVVDLLDLQAWNNCLHKIVEDVQQIDAIINNAGFGIFDYIEKSDWNKIESMVQLNILALIRAVHQLLPHFIERKQGHIINIGSQAGKIATPKSAVYSATKHAVIGFTNALRLEVEEKGIFVTSVNLGPVRTNFFELADPSGTYQHSVDRFMLDPETVAKKVVGILFTNKREINMPRWMSAGSKMYQLFPSLMERLLKNQFNRK
ncbi:SDR family oxidoreductase [Aquibacillus koreensis]|uniref:SDR family oxidoreductase n=1 Tax=Aquibacillus koreensis TaxID=279446 RepID=A0A9X3WKR5_9BACI|nr:SDR family oxidoreductase [Aquibacillus koreensis]MCT2537460.1 SDR family oxidoreductase [Aquibacillus koreensis]MDC3418906.1 SDR family oxidoreductase [Aquibacillus koreensis]